VAERQQSGSNPAETRSSLAVALDIITHTTTDTSRPKFIEHRTINKAYIIHGQNERRDHYVKE